MLSRMIFESNPGWDLIKSLFNYYGLRDYLSFWYHDRFDPEGITEIPAYEDDPDVSGEEVFWRKVKTGRLLEGDPVRLYNFQVSPWFPRKPGLYWTYEAALARQRAMQRHVERVEGNMIVFDVYGKTLMSELGGVGTVNFRKNRDKVLITATASGHTQRGIPIVCSQQIWDEIDKSLRADAMIEIDLQGTLEAVPTEFDSFFLRSPGVPKIAVHVKSILNVKIKVSRLKVFVTPWTIFESSNRNYPYGFTYITHNLFEDDMNASVKWMTDYIERKEGKVVLTDFDEETNPLNAVFPLNGCIDGSVLNSDILKYCQRIKRRFEERGRLFPEAGQSLEALWDRHPGTTVPATSEYVAPPVSHSGRPVARVDKYFEDRGFGFLEIVGKDKGIFFHIKDVEGRDAVQVGEYLEYSIGEGRKGPQAIKLRVVRPEES
jgi:CspA family cold shock protein